MIEFEKWDSSFPRKFVFLNESEYYNYNYI